MAIIVKSRDEIAIMKEAGRIVSAVRDLLVDSLRPGMVELELDEIARREFKKAGVIPTFLDYHGYPATVCISINDEIVHGIPGKRKIQDGDIGHAIQTYVEGEGLAIVREYVGHGVGREMHEEPAVPNYGKPDTGTPLRPGMVIAIEPMVNLGDWRTKRDDDEWTVRTIDGALSAHFEHTLAITDGEAEVLTLP